MASRLAVCAIAATGIAICYYVLMYWRYIRSRQQNGCEEPPRYAHKDPIFGLDLFLKVGKQYEENRHLPELSKLFAENGNTFQTINMGSRNLYTIEPENLRTIFSNSSQWGVQPIRLAPMEAFCGRGFLTVDGDLWHQSRKMFQPSFQKDAISDFSALETYTQKMMSQVPQGGTSIDMQPLLSSLFVNATTLFLFGESFDELSGTFTATDVSQAFDQAMFGSGMRIALGPLGFLAKTSKWINACKRTQSFAEAYVDKALRYQQDTSLKEEVDAAPKHPTLLHSLAKQTNDKEHLRNEILQAFFVSQGTTSNCVANFLFLVARQPKLWTRLREEMLQVVKETDAPTYDQLQTLSLLRNCLNESMRLFPILPQNQRVALVDTVLPTGGGPSGQAPVFVQAGTKVNVSYYTLHRREDLWGEDAAEFKPDRWDDIDDAAYKFLPFGAGPRQCIGKAKALAESSYVIVRLMQRFGDIKSMDDREWQGKVQLSAQNLHGCHVAFSAIS